MDEDILLPQLQDIIIGMMFGDENQKSFYNGKLAMLSEVCKTLDLKPPFEITEKKLNMNLNITFQNNEG